MSGPEKSLADADQRLECWKLLLAAADGEDSARTSLIEQLEAEPLPASALTRMALEHAGSEADRAPCEKHFADAVWSKRLPLELQEYSAVFPKDTRFHQDIRTAFAESGWAQGHLQALKDSGAAGTRAARALLYELQGIPREASELLARLQSVRARVKAPLHILQAQALVRTELALGSLRGRKVLEVGPQEGALLLEMIRQGADVLGVDLGPLIDSPHIIQGDFLHTALPGPFELIVATAVFEMGSCARGEPDSDAKNGTPEILKRLHALTAPGSVVVLENVMFPIPFLQADAERAGFEVLRLPMSAINLQTGGRSCALRHVRA